MPGMKNIKKRAGACDVEAVEPSNWQKTRITRQQRLYRAMLLPASAALVEQRPADAKWFCLNVFDGAELTVESRLVDGGVKALVPREKFDKIVKGDKIEGERACFTGYVFIRIVPSALAFERLRRVKGVVDFLHNGERYHTVRDHDLGFYADKLNIDRMKADKTIGDRCEVIIRFGPFAGLECVVLQVTKPKSREPLARVWSKLYGREMKNVPLAFMEKV
ncbi:Transcription antitermination protein NusG [Neorhizobium galegae bv. officinalis]|nr:Transcription antitermination protein NusG [Neorhizobium galegae bv. officinalis]